MLMFMYVYELMLIYDNRKQKEKYAMQAQAISSPVLKLSVKTEPEVIDCC